MFMRTAALAAFLSTCLAMNAIAAEQGTEELRCRGMVDGQVAWNQQGSATWDPANVAALCSGATRAEERIACFKAGIASHGDWNRAIAECAVSAAPISASPTNEEQRCRGMVEGKVAWNQQGTTNWDPANIEALCSGATSADDRIACFNAGIAGHGDWSRAIAECAAGAGPAPAPVASQGSAVAPPTDGSSEVSRTDESNLCKHLVQDKVPMDLRTPDKRHWGQADLARLCDGSVNANETLKCFLKTIYNNGNLTNTAVGIETCRTN